MLSITNSGFTSALHDVLKARGKAEFDGYLLEYCDLAGTDQDSSSAFLSTSASSTLVNDANNADLEFVKFIGKDFARNPFLLISKESKFGTTEKSQKQTVSPADVKSRFSPKKNLRMSEKSDSSDVWGSPLKWRIPSDDSSIDSEMFDTSQASVALKKRYPKRLGIPLNAARRFLSMFTLQSDSCSNAPALLVLCDGADQRSSAVSGTRIVHITDQGKTRKGIKTTMVTVQPTSTEWNKKVQLKGESPSCRAVYQVSMPAEDGEEPWGMVAVELSWMGASQLLEPPPSDARSSIKASVRSGNMRSSMHKFFMELDLLRRIVTALDTGEMEWVSDVSEKKTTPLTTAVRNLLHRLKDEGSMGAVTQTDGETDETLTFASALKGISIAERNDYDFTDHLWKVMVDCMSTAELVDSLRFVFSALGRGELQPFVDQQNQTTVAQIVRESFTGRFSAPSLAGAQPFLFLAEIGAEKLRRDYINIFVSQNLANMSFLSPFITAEGDLKTRLGLLEKLHASLEMVALLSGSLRLSPETLGTAARQMLTHLTGHAVDPQHTFTFPLKTAEVHAILSSLRPVLWSAETSVNVGEMQESNLYCLCAGQPFLHVKTASEDSINESKVGKETDAVSDQRDQYCLVHRSETVMIL